jgi:Putative peptidoglycan binding domain
MLNGLLYTCVIEELAPPARVVRRIESTRALDGMQEESWDNFSALWTFHPDDGLSLTIWVSDPLLSPIEMPSTTTTLEVTIPEQPTDPPTTIETSTTDHSPPTEADAVAPDEVAASCQAPDSEEADGTPIVFSPGNVLDDDPATVWRCEASVDDMTLRLTFDAPTRLTSVGLIGGYVKVDPLTGVDRFTQNHRVRQVRWTFSDGTSVVQDLDDSRNVQSIGVNVTTTIVTMEILATYPPGGDSPRDMVPVAEVMLESTVETAPTTTGPECQFAENDQFPLERCDAGPAIAAAQSMLQVREYEIGTVDCLFGDQTTYAVRDFQADESLPVTGVVDDDTWAALDVLDDWGTDSNGNGSIEPDEITLICA